jgi:hypothetical protein
MIMANRPKRKQKPVHLHELKDKELIKAIDSDKSLTSFNALVNQLLREHYKIPLKTE